MISEEINNLSTREASKNASFLPGLNNPKLLSLSLFGCRWDIKLTNINTSARENLGLSLLNHSGTRKTN
mgnify:CR=1 FL=1